MFDALKIYIDGSAITNPGSKVGCAGIVKYPDYCNETDRELAWPYNIGTSNSMELLALVNTLKWINKNSNYLKQKNISHIIILSDCQNIVDGCRWVHGWQKNKWKKYDGGSIKNLSLWKDYFRERQKIYFYLDIKWIRGKSEEQTKKIDKLAKEVAEKSIKKTNFSHIKIKMGKSLSGKKFLLETFRAKGQSAIIRVYAHGAINQSKETNYEIRFEEIGINHDIIGRFKAYTSKEIDCVIDRGHFYYAKFNNNKNNLNRPWVESIKEIKSKELDKLKKKVKERLGMSVV